MTSLVLGKKFDIEPVYFSETVDGAATVVFENESDAEKFNYIVNKVFKGTLESTRPALPDMPSTVCNLKPVWKEKIYVQPRPRPIRTHFSRPSSIEMKRNDVDTRSTSSGSAIECDTAKSTSTRSSEEEASTPFSPVSCSSLSTIHEGQED